MYIPFMVRSTFTKVSETCFFYFLDTFISLIWYIFHRLRSGFCNILVCTSIFRKNEVQHLIFKKGEPISIKKHLFLDEMRYRKQVLRVCTSQQINCVEFINQQNKLKYIPIGSKWNWRRIRRVAVRVWDASPSRRPSQILTDTRLVGANGALE